MSDSAPATSSHDLPVPPALAEFMLDGWAPVEAPVRVHPEVASWAAKRRARLTGMFPGEHLVVPAGAPPVRSNDQYFRFRPGSDYTWLTGDGDRGGVLVLDPSGDATLYSDEPPRPGTAPYWTDRAAGIVWNGPRADLAALGEALQLRCRSLAELPGALDAAGRARLLRTVDAGVDALVPRTDPIADTDLVVALADLRLIKDEWEVGQLQHAVDVTVRGFEDVVRAIPEALAGGGERWLEGSFSRRARTDGEEVGYQPIVASGARAAILHWNRNTGPVRPGELLLLDAGVEVGSRYTADITRVLPVDGRFSPLQRDVYELVRRANDAAIGQLRPGAMFRDYHWAAMAVFAAGLVDLGLLRCSVDEALDPERQLYRRWTLCGSGHMLGLDVHDCGRATSARYVEGELQAGMVLTVEPGLYFQPNDELVPVELRGLGMRIEEDLLITEDGSRNLSAALPRTADDIEGWMSALAG
ncbi:aminopeptidase P family protein [Plantactinospora soyae]|uniref:Xaa-Pro aminopeptidase n=1 Tax=Plantactinospora soyae TaxID=1544732 RepID=A0A927MB91_9ACTN|nr:aminopeptidase P family protein [Plantactinospora soyae]MBE1489966.1 Xaa-Pro aminopeptidase [Plantactinospora soyae]